ncbi:MAG: FKBP-type peptidyl-prolyl cis-trans isomerase [Bacteroidota bacterium]|nr:FKBP-type peptidyl-prolyl cis-trans isomerase [Bacteroidota bacterium]
MYRNLLIIILLSFVFVGCNHYSKTESGLRYQFLQRGKGIVLPSIGDYLQCHISIYNANDSMFYSTFGRIPERILLTTPTHKGGDIMNALSILSEGDSLKALINADSFFLKTRGEIVLPDYVKTGSDLKFIIKLERRLNAFQVDSLRNAEKIERWKNEIVMINQYVIKEGLEVKIDTLTGLRYQFHQKLSDTAQKIRDGSIVTFHFIGKLMDGTEFFNSYTMGQAQTIKVFREQFQPIGMYEILTRMKQGEKATFILPYDLAFGARGVEGMIPPFASLVYKVNILKVR